MYQKAFAPSTKETKAKTNTSDDDDTTPPKDAPPSEEGPPTDTPSNTSTLNYLWNNKFLWDYIFPYGFQIGIMMTFLWIFIRHSNVMQNPQEDTFTEAAQQQPPSADEF